MITKSEFAELRDITQGEFAIASGCLFYKDQKIASQSEIILASTEEVFFLFKVEDEEVKKEFPKVIFMNFRQCRFYKCNEVLATSRELQFTSPANETHSFRLISYHGSYSTKAVASNFQNWY